MQLRPRVLCVKAAINSQLYSWWHLFLPACIGLGLAHVILSHPEQHATGAQATRCSLVSTAQIVNDALLVKVWLKVACADLGHYCNLLRAPGLQRSAAIHRVAPPLRRKHHVNPETCPVRGPHEPAFSGRCHLLPVGN